jgi:hypothetical protein
MTANRSSRDVVERRTPLRRRAPLFEVVRNQSNAEMAPVAPGTMR